MLEFCFIKRWPLSKARLWWFLRNEVHAELLAMVLLVMWSLTLLFSFSPGLYILDVDKCSDGSHDCHPNATCWGDTAGNFTCTCQAGFTGNGRQCYGKLIRKCTYLTNSFHVAVRLFSNRSQMTSKCGKKEEVAHEPQASAHVSPMFLPHFDVLCNLLLNKPTAAWNLFVLYNDQHRKKTNTNTCLAPLDCLSICASLGIF